MSPPSKSKAKHILGNTIQISHIVLTALNDAARMAPVPYLQQAAGLALGILNIVQGAKDNKDAFQKLAADTCELVYAVLSAYEEATKKGNNHIPSRKLVDDLQGLLGTLSCIERFSRKEVSRGAFVRLLSNKTDRGMIQDYRDTLRRSLDLFGIQSNVAIRGATSQIIGQHEKMLQALQHDTEKKGSFTVTPAQTTFKSIKDLVPLLDRVLVQRFNPELKSATGTFSPTSSTYNPQPIEATVIAVGPGAPNKDGQIIPPQVKAGDRVLLPGWGGPAINVGKEEYIFLKDSEILAKINE